MNKLYFVTEPDALPASVSTQLAAKGFQGEAGQIQSVTNSDGTCDLYVGTCGDLSFWVGAEACQKAQGLDQIAVQNPHVLEETDQQSFALSWLLESYRFELFKPSQPACRLDGMPPNARTRAVAAGMGLSRDLINTPPNLMRPGDLAERARAIAAPFGAEIVIHAGDELKQNFPLIHTVGAAAGPDEMAPRLIDMTWGQVGPTLTLVGKGISFDTGGLNLKPGQSMRLMKKDMGGAAHVLGLAHMIMALDLPLQMRVLIPTAENAVGAGAFRPGDVVQARSGLSVEIDNTDAEGRLVLADALTYASEGDAAADLTISMATLTGAARVAVGPEIALYFTNEDSLNWQLLGASDAKVDPLWPLPLYQPYGDYLKSDVADLVNSGGGGFAGAITAALFLGRFVDPRTRWAHFDIYGWNPKARPGRPQGGAAQGLMALLNHIEDWILHHG